MYIFYVPYATILKGYTVDDVAHVVGIGCAVVAATLGVFYIFRVHQAYFDFFRSCCPKRSVLFIAVSAVFGLPLIFTGCPLGIFTFICRDQDLGLNLPGTSDDNNECVLLTEVDSKAESKQTTAISKAFRTDKSNKRIIAILTAVVSVVIAFDIILTTVVIPGSQYKKATALLNKGEYRRQ